MRSHPEQFILLADRASSAFLRASSRWAFANSLFSRASACRTRVSSENGPALPRRCECNTLGCWLLSTVGFLVERQGQLSCQSRRATPEYSRRRLLMPPLRVTSALKVILGVTRFEPADSMMQLGAWCESRHRDLAD